MRTLSLLSIPRNTAAALTVMLKFVSKVKKRKMDGALTITWMGMWLLLMQSLVKRGMVSQVTFTLRRCRSSTTLPERCIRPNHATMSLHTIMRCLTNAEALTRVSRPTGWSSLQSCHVEIRLETCHASDNNRNKFQRLDKGKRCYEAPNGEAVDQISCSMEERPLEIYRSAFWSLTGRSTIPACH